MENNRILMSPIVLDITKEQIQELGELLGAEFVKARPVMYSKEDIKEPIQIDIEEGKFTWMLPMNQYEKDTNEEIPGTNKEE